MEARNKLGEIYRRRKLYDRAIAEHEQAKRVDPFFVSNLNNLALAYLKKGNNKASLREAQAALRIRSDFGPAHYTLAAVYDLIGQFNLALEHFNRSIQLGFQNDFEHLDIVKSYWKTTKSLR